MKMKDVVDEIKLGLTGDGLLDLELSDESIQKIVYVALRRLTRFWDETSMVTVPFASCIDLSDTPLANASSIIKVYRTVPIGDSSESTYSAMSDPMYAQQWMIFSNAGTMYSLKDYVQNYAAWSTLTQIRNTLSTDMAFKEDKHNNKLYINEYLGRPQYITIEFIPKLTKVEDIKSDYWQDILVRLSIILTKKTIGRIRTKYKQSGALWELDGESLLNEANTEYDKLMDKLEQNANMVYPID